MFVGREGRQPETIQREGEIRMSHQVFISCGEPDRETARRLYNDLKAAGFRPWMDEVDLLPGQKWETVIRRAIRESRYFLALLSSESISKRGFVHKALKTALDILDEFPDGGVFLIPVRIDNCTPADDRLRDLHAVDLFPDYEPGLDRIIRGLRSEDPSSGENPDNGAGESVTLNILHLSDLHFGTLDNARNWHDQLAEDLKGDLDCQRLDALIVSGDIANRSEPGEYDAAAEFLRLLAEEFQLAPAQQIIVPGNHDLNWKLARKGYDLKDIDDYEGDLDNERVIQVGDDAVRVRNPEKYRKRFDHFSRFYEAVKGMGYPRSYPDQAVLHHLPAQRLLILGINSAWNLDHHFRSRAAIHPEAITAALGEIRRNSKRYADCLKLAVFHHPLVSPFEDRITDHGFMERLAGAGFRLALHGHIHKAERGQYAYDVPADGRRIQVIGAGTFGAPVKDWTPGYPLQYNLLRFSRNRLTVETRCRREINGAWGPDAIWLQGKGKDPVPRYDVELPGWSPGSPIETDDSDQDGGDPPPAPARPSEIEEYNRKIEGLHETLPVMGFKTRLRVPIRIADVYVPLRVVVDLRATGDSCFADAADADECLKGRGEGREISVPDAFKEAHRLGRRGIVILGDPGSGKTTHLKRLLIWCLRGGLADLGLPDGTIPVFLPLRELRDLKSGLDAFIEAQLEHPHLQTPAGFGRRLLARGNLLLLFDGLDEVAEPGRRAEVSRWIDAAIQVHRSCRFLVTSRFAGYTPEARLNGPFIEMHLRPLSADQAEAFIHNWYRSVETGLLDDGEQAEAVARDQAGDLIERLRQPEFRSRRVFAMTRNPLLLTNLCLVHRDRGYLPQSRSRLYGECIEVLLELWRGAIGIRGRVTAETGKRVLQPAALWMHGEEERTRATAAELAPVMDPVLKTVGWEGGSAADFLEAVRNDSGLLTGWGQDSFGFMHLGFQEYLAAREIWRRHFSGDPDTLRELASQFGRSWWQEVALLLLSFPDLAMFEPYIREVVTLPAFAQHPDLMDLCLDDAAEVSAVPFLELIDRDPGGDRDLWDRQLLALRIVERIDAEALAGIFPKLKTHPSKAVREWVAAREFEAGQEVIHSDPGGYELVRIPGGRFMMGGK